MDLREIIATIRISGDLSLTETSKTRCSLRLHEDGGEVLRAFAAPLWVAGLAFAKAGVKRRFAKPKVAASSPRKRYSMHCSREAGRKKLQKELDGFLRGTDRDFSCTR